MPGRPLVVSGLPRSGTSWVGKMLEASGSVVYVNEPLNPQHPPGQSPGVLDAAVTHRFQYICPDNEEPWQRAFADTLRLRYKPVAELRRNHGGYDVGRLAKYATSFTVGRLRGRRAMLDDPFAILSVPWLVERMGCEAAVLVRHPLSLAGSWRALGWRIRFHELLEQPLLVRDYLGRYEAEMRRLVGSDDWIAQISLLWRATYAAVDEYRQRVPGVTVWRYEDFATEPLRTFPALYASLGLDWNERVAAQVVRATTGADLSKDSHRWSLRGGVSRTAYRPMDSRAGLTSYRRRLSADDIRRICELTADVVDRFYDVVPG